MFKNAFFRQSLLFLSVFALSGGATMYMMYQTSTHPDETPEEVVMTPAQKMLSSIINYEILDIDANFEATYNDPNSSALLTSIVDFKGKVDIRNLDALKMAGTLDVHAGGSNFNAGLAYYCDGNSTNNKMYLDYNNSHFVLEQAHLMDFVDMVPIMGSIQLPPELANIDLNKIAEDIPNMEPKMDNDGKPIFTLDSILPGLEVNFKTDEEYNCEAIKTNYFTYENVTMKLYADLGKAEGQAEIINPEKGEFAGKYKDFTPALNLIAGLEKVFGQEENTIGLNIGIRNSLLQKPEIIDIKTDISYNKLGHVSLGADIIENERSHKFDALLKEGTLFVNQENVNKISFKGSTLSELIHFLLTQVSNNKVGEILDHIALVAKNDKVTTTIQNIKDVIYGSNAPQEEVTPVEGEKSTLETLLEILEKVECLNNWVKHIDVEGEKTSITLDLSGFGVTANEIVICLSGNENQFQGVEIKGLQVNDTIIDVEVMAKEFNMFNISESDEASYVELDPIVGLAEGLFDVAMKDQFRFEVEGLVDDTSAANQDTKINAGFQFDIMKQEGYGEANILEPNGHPHKIQADVNKSQELNIVYNEKMKGRMQLRTLGQIGTTIMDLFQGKNELFNDAFHEVMQGLLTTPIFKAVRGDVGALFALKNGFVLQDVVVDETAQDYEVQPLKAIKLQINGGLFGMGDDNMISVVVNCNEGFITDIEVKDIAMSETSKVGIKLKIVEFDQSLENNRLQSFPEAFNLDDLKLLIDLGIETISFKNYHLKGEFSLDFSLIGFKPFQVKSIPIELEIQNIKGQIKAIATMPDVPVDFFIPIFVNKEYYKARSRSVTFMYENGYVYGNRVDSVNDRFLGRYRDVNYTFKAEENHFVNNLQYYLCDFAFTFSDSIIEQINKPQTPSTPSDAYIHYENLINKFAYQNNSNYEVAVNLAELTKNPDLTNCVVNLYHDVNVKFIERLALKLRVQLPANCSIGIMADLKFVSHDEIDFTRIANFDAQFGSKVISEDKTINIHLHDPKKGDRVLTTTGM